MSKELILELLENFIPFDSSISPGQDLFPNKNAADYFHEFGKNNGFETFELEGISYLGKNQFQVYPGLMIKRGKNPGKTVLFLGHLDVVPVSDVEKEKLWKYEPFKSTTDGDRVYGRGSADMLGPVASFMAAFKDYNIDFGNLIIAVSGDEEIGGMDSVPAIIERLKGLDLSPDYVINAEPSSLPIIITKRRGGSWLTMKFPLDIRKSKGYLKEITVKTRTGGNLSETLHSSYFVLGSDSHAMITIAKYAVDKIVVDVNSSSIKTNSVPAEVIMKYIDYDENGSELEYSHGLTMVMTSMASVASLNWPIIPSKYGISICPNLLHLDREKGIGEFVFDIRAMLKDKDSHEVLRQTLVEHFSRNLDGIEIVLNAGIHPVNVDSSSYLPQKVNEICNKHGMRIIDIGEKLGGASDTRFFTELGIPGVEIGPIHGNAHGPNEWVSLNSLVSLVEIFRECFDELSRS